MPRGLLSAAGGRTLFRAKIGPFRGIRRKTAAGKEKNSGSNFMQEDGCCEEYLFEYFHKCVIIKTGTAALPCFAAERGKLRERRGIPMTVPKISGEETYLFNNGKFYNSYLRFGAHLCTQDGREGVCFTVWAPRAVSVSVEGDFNRWDGGADPMSPAEGGIWTAFVAGAKEGDRYKYLIRTEQGDFLHKGDPFAFFSEEKPKSASVVYDLTRYRWEDEAWQRRKRKEDHRKRPMNIYEVNFASWRRNPDGSYYTYEQLAAELIPYVKEMGYTHIEVMPLTEHPFDGSWGYQTTGYFSATSRFGTPDGLRAFIDGCHREEVGVIMDWVPGHFCMDAHGLGLFDGTPLYEGAVHRHWGTYKTNFARRETWSFFISSALFWLEQFRFDGLRVDGVTSMLYLDFDAENGESPKNRYGGRENLEAVEFIRTLNREVLQRFPKALMIAEESTDWPQVTRPDYDGGLGFNYKWNMGWMNDSLKYAETGFEERRHCHNLITFSLMYAFSENFILPLSHDEVVHGKKSLLDKMAGDNYNKFAGSRCFAVYQMTHPGKKLNFMGNEFAQYIEWNENESLEWFMLDYPLHRDFRTFIQALNRMYLENPALYEKDDSWESFRWIDVDNNLQSVFLYERLSKKNHLLVALNFKPRGYGEYRIGVSSPGSYREILNSDETGFGGHGYFCNPCPVRAEAIPFHGQDRSILVKLPPLSAAVFRRETAGKTRHKKTEEK